MRLKHLVAELEGVRTWEKPKVELEQYPTPPDIAAHMLMAAHAEGDIEDCMVADLGCGGGVLPVALGAHFGGVVSVDISAPVLAAARDWLK